MIVILLGGVAGSFYSAMKFNQLYGSGRVAVYRYFQLLLPVFCLILIFTESVYYAALWIFLVVFCSSTTEMFVITQLQLTAPSILRGRIMSVYIMTTSASAIFGFMIGVLIDALNKNILLVQGLVTTVAVLVIYPLVLNKEWLNFLGYLATEKRAIPKR